MLEQRLPAQCIRMRRIFSSLLGLIVVSGWIAPGHPECPLATTDSPQSGTNAVAEYEAQDLDGRIWRLGDLRGRIVILNFWALWCAPCQREMPVLQRMADRYEVFVQVLAPTLDDVTESDKIRRLASKLKLTFPLCPGATAADMSRFGLSPKGIPQTVIIDPSGRIHSVIPGELNERKLESRIREILESDPAES